MAADAADGAVEEVGDVRVTAGEEVWSRFSGEVFGAVCDEEGECEGEGEAHPAGVTFPEFAAD